jgi:hypothetical protein
MPLCPKGAVGDGKGAETDVIALSLHPRMDEVRGKARVLIDLAVRNRTNASIRVEPERILGTCDISSKPLNVLSGDGQVVQYRGLYEYRLKGPVVYETLGPGQTLTVRNVDLTNFYAFPAREAQLTFEFEGFPVECRGPGLWVQARSVPLAYKPVERDGRDAELDPTAQGVVGVERTKTGTTITCNLER